MRVAWVLLPFTVGATIGEALADAARSTQVVVTVGSWCAWTVVLVGIVIRRPWGLTALRVVAPCPAVIALVAAAASNTSWLALGHGAVVLAGALLPEVGSDIVDGLSYGDERRLMLRPPFGLYLGLLQLVWALVVVGIAAGPLLLAAQKWLLAVPVTVVGFAAAYLGLRSLHQLSRRWIVFVPNGFVVHDLFAAREPFLLRRQDVEAIGPASADLDLAQEGLVDVSLDALGVVLEVRLDGEIEIVPRAKGVSQVVVANRVLFTPTRPGAVLAEARKRRIPR